MDENKDRKSVAADAAASAPDNKNRDKRAKKGGKYPRRNSGNDPKRADRQVNANTDEQSPAPRNAAQQNTQKRRPADTARDKTDAADKQDRNQRRRQQPAGAGRGEQRRQRTGNSASPAQEPSFIEQYDSFADISLSGNGRISSVMRNDNSIEDNYVPSPDAFRIPDEDILPECLLPRTAQAAPAGSTEGKTEVVGIRFEKSGKTYYFAPGADKFTRGEHAIVETARGMEYGEISMGNTFVPNEEIVQPLRAVGRRANEEDAKHDADNHKREAEALTVCAEKIAARGLDMKLVGSSYTFDNSKLIFYFTAAGRVDFRELVKDLAAVFRTRIELRQIGIRDEAKMLGGCGVCGRKLCCSSFLPNFNQVSIRMAKEQGLSLSSSKISGCCGRLMCCLRFEHDTYEREIKLTPPVESVVDTADGRGVVTENNPIAGTVKVRLEEKPDDPPKIYHRDTVKVISRGTRRQDSAEPGDDDDIAPEE